MQKSKVDDQRQKFEGIASVLLANANDLAELSSALNGVVAQSIGDAILKARHGLGSELVSWNLADLSGQMGGFTEVCEARATIYAKAGPP